MPQQYAFSLIELLAVIACLSILLANVLPNWQQHHAKMRLLQATESLAQDLRTSRSLSIKHNIPYYIHYDTANNHTNQDEHSDEEWCYILSSQSDCHCLNQDQPPHCVTSQQNTVLRISSRDYPGIHLTEARFGKQHYTRFEPIRGTALFGRLLLENDFQQRLKINISLLGRIRICQPQNSIPTGAYAAC